MRECSEIQELLSSYIDDFLEPMEKEKVEKHLENCPQCQKELAELQQTVQMFASLNEEELIPPASFRRELREKLEKAQSKKKVGFGEKVAGFFSNFKLKPWMPLAMAAVLLIVIVPVAMMGLWPSGTTNKEMATDSVAPEIYNSADGEAGMRNFSITSDNYKTFKLAPGASDAGVAQEEQAGVPETVEIERKIIKTGYINLEVDDYKETTGQINTLVEEMQGYIVNEHTYVYDQELSLLAGNVTLRIPEERFNEALNRMEQLGTVLNRSVNSQDVTEEYVDVQSRLKAMRLKEERLLALLGKSGTLGDVLAVENELAKTRADIEALEGRIKYLDNRTELSTINLEIRETLTPVKKIKTTGLQGVMHRFQESFIKSINTIIIGFGNFIVALGAFIPYIILLICGIGLVMILWRKYKNRKS